MATTTNFKDIIDLPEWRPLAVSPNTHAVGGCLVSDLRDSEDRYPSMFQLASAAILNKYHAKNDGWGFMSNPGLAGTFGAGANAIWSCRGPSGTILAGSTTTKLVLGSLTNAHTGFTPFLVVGAVWSRSTTTATITQNNHGFSNNQVLVIQQSSDVLAIVQAAVVITVSNGNQFTFTCLNAGATAGNISYVAATAPLSWSRSTTTATITHNSHGYVTGQWLSVVQTSDAAAIVLGQVQITYIGANSYSFVCLNAGGASGTISVIPSVMGVTEFLGLSWTRSTTTATITHTGHNFIVGQSLNVIGSSDIAAIVIGTVTVASVSAGVSYTFTCLNAGAASGTVSLSTITAHTYTRSTTTATVTQHNHGFSTGQLLNITIGSDPTNLTVAGGAISAVSITVTNAYTYTFTCLNAGAASGALEAGIMVGTNQLANRGDVLPAPVTGYGFKIRVIGRRPGGSGKTEEKYITANTWGNTPIVTLDSALSFTPAAGDRFEILSGRVYMVSAGVLAAGWWKYYDVATNSLSGQLATTNLVSAHTATSLVCLDESYVPDGATSNTGFFGVCTATASSATSITGQTTLGESTVLADEYRNFQIRIVEDTGNPLAVGQRRLISTHTAGTSAVYTVTAWTNTPSATAKFVIENNNQILLWSNVATALSTYAYTQPTLLGSEIADNAWSTTRFAPPAVLRGAGTMAWHPFGISPTVLGAQKTHRNSFIYVFRGGSTALDVFDISGSVYGSSPTGGWQLAAQYGGTLATTFVAGACAEYEPSGNNGRFVYINLNGTQNMYRFCSFGRNLEPWGQMRYAQGAVVEGARMARSCFYDGATEVPFLYILRSSGVELFSILISR